MSSVVFAFYAFVNYNYDAFSGINNMGYTSAVVVKPNPVEHLRVSEFQSSRVTICWRFRSVLAEVRCRITTRTTGKSTNSEVVDATLPYR
jgi:hypothetical protein